jgi:hypothetical protein
MELSLYIEQAFPSGISYNDAVQLCLRLYATLDGVPKGIHAQCTKDTLAEAFARLAVSGVIVGESVSSARYGANFHAVCEKGHWIEVIASIFKLPGAVDFAAGAHLVRRLSATESDA